MNFLGVAAAVHGVEHLKLTTSVVGGPSKDDIRLQASESLTLDVQSVGDVRRKFTGMLTTMGRVIGAQRNAPTWMRVPLVFGLPVTYDSWPLLGKLAEGFSYPIPPQPKVSPDLTPIFRQRIAAIMGEIFSKELTDGSVRLAQKGDFSMITRGFIDTIHVAQLSPQEIKEAERAMDLRWAERFEELKRGGAARREELKALVRQHAAGYAQELLDLSYEDSRFFGTTSFAFSPEIRNHTFFNFFKDDEELRRVMGGEIIRILNIPYNISLKCPMDVPSPPFVDVVATYLADQMDQVFTGRVNPSVVRAKPLSKK